jgi:biotin carboxyl carrier protein
MKKLINYSLLFCIVLVSACKSGNKMANETIITPKTPVKVVTFKKGSIEDDLDLFGTTTYLKRNVVSASIPGFITAVYPKLGDRVNKGDVLYILQSKESRALENGASQIDSSLANFGIIKVKAPATGVISTLDKQQPGDYVLEGTQLCTIAESNDLVFQVNVPYEYTSYTQTGTTCTIILPDNKSLEATFTKALTMMNAMTQTQTILAKAKSAILLPENMIVKVVIQKKSTSKKQILPVSCVLSDEMMQEFWVMKLINDSTAVKVPVQIGSKNTKSIEILSPQFNVNDQIISTGNYGLPDTALISIQ